MEQKDIRALLSAVKSGEVSVEDAVLQLKMEPFTELGFAKPDLHRGLRQGAAEVIYGAGKTPEQIRDISRALLAGGQDRVLITRMSPEAASVVGAALPLDYHEMGKIGIIGGIPEPDGDGSVVIATGGTSDMPVAEEAAATCAFYGNEVVRLYDVGVAGVERLLSQRDTVLAARVMGVVAGMEGALASVVGGLVDVPVIAVPTSVGYGAAFEGLAALLAMLNSCAAGVSVVNIDNGFGAGFLASRINHLG